jgi:arginyl-tRNA synthetase
MEAISKAIRAVTHDLFGISIEPIMSRPDEQFGDYATNIAMQLAGQLGKNPREIAEAIAEQLRSDLTETVEEVSIAAPGFINLRLTDKQLLESFHAATETPQLYTGQEIVAEYSDPNPFKVLHAGHIYTSVVGDAIANLLAQAGATVHRVNFGGDVGLHVAKTMWAMLEDLGGDHPEKLDKIPVEGRSEWMATCYVAGTRAYEEDEAAKELIVSLNKRVYQLFSDNDHESPFARIYWTCRQWSYDYFNAFYERIGTPFEKYYPESEVAPLGLQTVREEL